MLFKVNKFGDFAIVAFKAVKAEEIEDNNVELEYYVVQLDMLEKY